MRLEEEEEGKTQLLDVEKFLLGPYFLCVATASGIP